MSVVTTASSPTAAPRSFEPPLRVVSAAEMRGSMSWLSPRIVRLSDGRRSGGATPAPAVETREAGAGVATWRPRVTTTVRVTVVAASSKVGRPEEPAAACACGDDACVAAGSAASAADTLEPRGAAWAGCGAVAGSAGAEAAVGAAAVGCEGAASLVLVGDAAAAAGAALVVTAGSACGGKNGRGSTYPCGLAETRKPK